MDWFQIAREHKKTASDRSDFTDRTEASPLQDAISPAPEVVTSVKSDLSGHFEFPSDPEALFSLLCEAGPMTYGAAGSSLGWGATRAWQADDALRRSGRVKPDHFGRMVIIKETDA